MAEWGTINPPERGKEYAPHDGHDQSSDAAKDDRARSTGAIGLLRRTQTHRARWKRR